MSSNQLSGETSPYLLQHKDNPVHWRPWGDEALAEAKASGKPILLSVGYAACHWCHVMAHESFEDPRIAAVMNELFVNIKVDREERPDVDIVYQTALALLGEQGGWPLTMFLTPDGDPFWGGTYFPPTARYGRPAFADVLRRVAEIHRDEKDKVAHNAEALKDAMARMAQPPSGGGLDGTALDATAEAALSVIDTVKGGTHGAPKFPQPSFFRFLWRSYRRNRDIRLRDAVTTTLDAICQGGIYDHLGGGFARYSTDAEWLVPHFEKMLYDNAQILELLAEAWQETGTELYRIRARETVDWLIRDMRVWANGDGPGTGMPFGFASAFDADSEGVEGQYYIWGQADIEALLGDRARPFIDAYGVTPKGNWEGVNILNRSARPELGDGAYEAGLAESRATLLAEREKRVPPTRDDKVLADWNGLTIAALANAGAIFDEPEWIDLARRVFEFICRNHTVDGRLRHSWCAGSARHPAVLDDYANLSRAALALFQATGSETYLNQAEAWVAVLDRRYWDPEGGGYYLTADDSHDLITRPKTVADNAVPPGNGTMVEVLARLYQLTGNTAYRDRADALVRIFSGTEVGHQINMPSLFMGFEMLDKPVQIVVVGDPAAPDTLALVRAAQNGAPPTHTLNRIAPGTDLPSGHPAHGMGQIDGRPTAYVCVGAACGLPSTDAGALRDELARL